MSFSSSPSPSLRRTVPTPNSGWRTRTPGRYSAAEAEGEGGAVRPGRPEGRAHSGSSLGEAAARGLGSPRNAAASRAQDAQALRGNLVQEAAPLGEPALAEDRPARRPAQGELLHGPGHAHVAEPPLLLERLGGSQAPGMGHETLLEAHEKHAIELETLGGVEGHEHHGSFAPAPGRRR